MENKATIFTHLTLAHWGIIGTGACLVLIVLFIEYALNRRRWRANEDLRGEMITAQFLTLNDLPKSAFDMIEQEAKRERKTKVIPKWTSDCGWGAPESEYDGVHFKSFIASSIHILESHAMKRDPNLSSRKKYNTSNNDNFSKSQLACDPKEYLERISQILHGSLPEEYCRQYLTFYRNARVPGRECTEQEFRSFLHVFKELLKRIEATSISITNINTV